MVSRNVFWGASNPFITGIFSPCCPSPHQSHGGKGVSRPNVWGASVNTDPPRDQAVVCGKLVKTDCNRGESERVCEMRAPSNRMCVCVWQVDVTPAGAIQVTATPGRPRESQTRERAFCQQFHYYVNGFQWSSFLTVQWQRRSIKQTTTLCDQANYLNCLKGWICC